MGLPAVFSLFHGSGMSWLKDGGRDCSATAGSVFCDYGDLGFGTLPAAA